MAEPVRHRQTKGAATDMFDLQPPRHISTLRFSAVQDSWPNDQALPPERTCQGTLSDVPWDSEPRLVAWKLARRALQLRPHPSKPQGNPGDGGRPHDQTFVIDGRGE